MKSRHHGLDLMNWNQQNYALQSLPKGLKFLCAVPPLESPKVMGLMGIHDPDPLCHFSGITHCPCYGKESQNKGTMVNHLQMVHYRLGLVCNHHHDCPSTMADTLHDHSWQECHQLGEKNPNKSASSVLPPEGTEPSQMGIQTRGWRQNGLH